MLTVVCRVSYLYRHLTVSRLQASFVFHPMMFLEALRLMIIGGSSTRTHLDRWIVD